MDRFVIHGGQQLRGAVKIQGNKNEALPALAACLLTDEPVILRNIPHIGDVLMMLDILRSIGAHPSNNYRITISRFVVGMYKPQR